MSLAVNDHGCSKPGNALTSYGVRLGQSLACHKRRCRIKHNRHTLLSKVPGAVVVAGLQAVENDAVRERSNIDAEPMIPATLFQRDRWKHHAATIITIGGAVDATAPQNGPLAVPCHHWAFPIKHLETVLGHGPTRR